MKICNYFDRKYSFLKMNKTIISTLLIANKIKKNNFFFEPKIFFNVLLYMFFILFNFIFRYLNEKNNTDYAFGNNIFQWKYLCSTFR